MSIMGSPAVMGAFEDRGYKNVGFADCEILRNGEFIPGDNFEFIIVLPNDTLNTAEVWLVRDRGNEELVVYTIGGQLGAKSPVKFNHSSNRMSLCSLFYAIVAPDLSEENFKKRLTLWQKGGGLFGGKKITALAYHCQKQRLAAGGKEESRGKEEESRGNQVVPNKPSNKGAMLGGAVVLLSVAALVYYLFKKRRDAKLELEREITAKAQLINTVVDTLNASENDKKLRTPRKRSSSAKTPEP